jgi:hypothetical protein
MSTPKNQMKFPKRLIIAVDFDGTLVEHIFPEIGEPVTGAFGWLQKFKNAGAFLILYTMRADERGAKSLKLFPGDRRFLSEAVEFCRVRGVEFDALNRDPLQDEWSASPKAYAHVYIDDAAFGCPLNSNPNGGRPTVNWSIVGPAVLDLIESHKK